MSKRIDHGSFAVFDEGAEPWDDINEVNHLDRPLKGLTADKVTRYDYLFPLQKNPDNLLPAKDPEKTRQALCDLGRSMEHPKNAQPLGSPIHSAYTYLAQFIDHDISFTGMAKTAKAIVDPCGLEAGRPLDPQTVTTNFANLRLGFLQLDSIYQSPAPRFGDYMRLGQVSPSPFGLAGDDVFRDVPRRDIPYDESSHDRAALIGDPRNDQTLILSQLHVVFLRAHNAIVNKGFAFSAARQILQQHFQLLIIDDFLKTVADENVVDEVLNNPRPTYNPSSPFFIPLEFSLAGFRFGHSMVRDQYYFNQMLPGVDLSTLFTYKALGAYPTLPDQKIIDWSRFLKIAKTPNMARPITTSIVEPLFNLVNLAGKPMPCEGRLAIIDLLRGYSWSLPTGQALAKAFKYVPKTPAQILSVASNEAQRKVLDSEFSERTPLWFYILAEAQIEANQRLGQLGSRLIAEVLIGLIRLSPNSIIGSGWSPTLGANKRFTIIDLVRLAQLV